MRQGKLSELIHNSANYEDLDFCSVEVHFREIMDLVRRLSAVSFACTHECPQPGRDDFEVIPNSSIVVTRTAYRDNKSKYTINGSSRTYTEVRNLLLAKGIDLEHKRFLILQASLASDSSEQCIDNPHRERLSPLL
jgi:structural maintenance of chromosome 4